MRTSAQAQAPVTKYPVGSGDDGVQDKCFESIRCDGRSQRQLQDDFARARQTAQRTEASTVVEAACANIVEGHEQPDTPAGP